MNKGTREPRQKEGKGKAVLWVWQVRVCGLGRQSKPSWSLFPSASLIDSAGLLSRDGITFFRCSRSSDGDVCAEREPAVKVLKGCSLLNKGGP